MAQQYYSVDQVADLLGLHVKTVRAYVREGRLAATRIGKQYRIRRQDLEEFTGGPLGGEEPSTGPEAPHAEVSSIVQVDGVDPATADRLITLVTAAAAGDPDGRPRAHAQVVHDPERARLKVVVVGGLTATATLLGYVESLIERG